MASTASRRTHRGAAVRCTDVLLGSVVGIERPESETEQYLRVEPDGGGEQLLVPMRLISSVDPDGTVHLTCTREQIDRWSDDPALSATSGQAAPVGSQHVGTLHLHEEQLVAHKELATVGEVQVRTEVEEVPGRLSVEAMREEVEVEHVPVGTVVNERVAPWEENGILVVPVYEEQLVLVKRLVMREQLRVRRIATTETRLFEDTLRRERVVVDDPGQTGYVHELYPATSDSTSGQAEPAPAEPAEGGFLGNLVRRWSGDEPRREGR